MYPPASNLLSPHPHYKLRGLTAPTIPDLPTFLKFHEEKALTLLVSAVDSLEIPSRTKKNELAGVEYR